MLKHLNPTRSIVAALAFLVASAAVPALAGPPLICHPFDTRGGALLPWDATRAKSTWNAPLPSYDTARLSPDVITLLDSDAPVLTRMENLRRATIYAQRDPAVARQLLDAVIARAKATGTSGPQAVFDAGYLIESYKQAVAIRGRKGGTDWATVDGLIKTDGYALVKKAMAMSGAPNAEMEFAASLMTEGTTSTGHRARATANAANGSALASNLAKY
jgi:hypothetical protein